MHILMQRWLRNPSLPWCCNMVPNSVRDVISINHNIIKRDQVYYSLFGWGLIKVIVESSISYTIFSTYRKRLAFSNLLPPSSFLLPPMPLRHHTLLERTSNSKTILIGSALQTSLLRLISPTSFPFIFFSLPKSILSFKELYFPIWTPYLSLMQPLFDLKINPVQLIFPMYEWMILIISLSASLICSIV